ncbi:endopeptidase La [Galenea microaerophila]
MDLDQIEMKMNVFVLPLRDVVVFPGTVIPLFVGREKSVNALNEAMQQDKQIFLVTQKTPDIDHPQLEDLYPVGTMANILQLLKLPDGTVKALIEGVQRFNLIGLKEEQDVLLGDIQRLKIPIPDPDELMLLVQTIHDRFEVYAELKKKLPTEVKESVLKTFDADRLVDLVSSNLSLDVAKKQMLLEMVDQTERLEKLLVYLETEIEILESERRINTRVKQQVDKTQRDFYLHEKIKAIHKELGEEEDTVDEFKQLKEKIETVGLPKAVQEKANSELRKLKMMSPQSPEATIVRNYLDWLLNIPWKKRSRLSKDLEKAEQILDAQHAGLEKVKERILEYLAVQKRVNKLKGPILCLVGPPGVGKTTLARSIAEATHRKYVRMSLGGVRDEAEIRGHRRTYIGAMPGKIIQKMKDAGTVNPLFLLDEIDKMAKDFRGDPASALLEVLDPEQNKSFNDHYLEVDYDLSNVMFVATSNSMDIPEPLLDRMEVINLAGYTEAEKLEIAKKHLLPRQLEAHGLKTGELAVTDEALQRMIQLYTREAGVRLLDREIAKLCRKVVKQLVLNEKQPPVRIDEKNLEEYLGVARYRIGLADEQNQIGQVSGLAWTRVGGDLLRIEATKMPGKGKVVTTGQLGSVMQESTQTAMSVIRSRSKQLGLAEDFYEKYDLHLHFPEGAIKKDGPSAGIAVCTAIASVFTEIPVRADVAMTGEITLRGAVLPIGGLKEKLLAALRGGIKKVLIPHENVRDLKEISQEITSQIEIVPVEWIDEVFKHALLRLPNEAESTAKPIEKTNHPIATETKDSAVNSEKKGVNSH